MALKLKVGDVQEHLRLTMHGLGQHVQDSVQTHSEIRRQTDENLLIDCIRNGKCRPVLKLRILQKKQKMHILRI